jgi:hypothetical protein
MTADHDLGTAPAATKATRTLLGDPSRVTDSLSEITAVGAAGEMDAL